MMTEAEKRTTTFYDLPETVQLKILSYITNIREKIRLASVSSIFYHLVSEACRIQSYKLVNLSDFMYESEIRKGAEHAETVFINLHKLLRAAPKLTHFVDKVYHFDYEVFIDRDRKQIREALPLTHTKYLSIDLSRFYFFGRPYERSFNDKQRLFLSNSDSLITLDIRTDVDFEGQCIQLSSLKALRLSYYATNRFPKLTPMPPYSLKILDNRLPNLEEFEFTSHFIDIYKNLPGILSNFSVLSPKLRYIKVTQHSNFRDSHFHANYLNDEYYEMPFLEDCRLDTMEYLDVRGAVFPLDWWEKILGMVPNLKYLVCNPNTDNKIRRLVARYCRHAKYNLERPAEIEDEFRHYTQCTYGFDHERYLYGLEMQSIPKS